MLRSTDSGVFLVSASRKGYIQHRPQHARGRLPDGTEQRMICSLGPLCSRFATRLSVRLTPHPARLYCVRDALERVVLRVVAGEPSAQLGLQSSPLCCGTGKGGDQGQCVRVIRYLC